MDSRKRVILLVAAALLTLVTHAVVSDIAFKLDFYKLSSGLGYHLGYIVGLLVSILLSCIASISAYVLLAWQKIPRAAYTALFLGVNVPLLSFAVFTVMSFSGLSLGSEWRLPLDLLVYIGAVFIGDWIFNRMKGTSRRKLAVGLLVTFTFLATPNALYLIF